MKKLLLGVLLGLLIVGITAPVWALEVTVGGEFRFRARQRSDFDLQAYNGNSAFGNDAPVSGVSYLQPAWRDYGVNGIELRPGSVKHKFEAAIPHGDRGNNDRDYLYDRIRVSVDAKIVEGLRAYVMFENYSDWGLSRGNLGASGGVFNVPQYLGGDGSASIYGDRAGLNIRFGWVDFVIPKTPVHVKIGRQPLALGHGILLDTRTWGGDMAYVYAPIGPVTAGAFYGKMIENDRSNEDDASFAGAHLDFAINPANKISAFYRLVWQRTTRHQALGDITTATFGGPTAPNGAALNRSVQYNSNQHGIGLTADGKISLGSVGLFYAGEIDYIWGQYKHYTEARTAKRWGSDAEIFQDSLRQSAWGYGVQLGVDLKYVKLDVAHSYSSGDKTRELDTVYAGKIEGRARLHQWSTGRVVETFTPWGGDGMYSPWNTDIFMGSTKSANYGGAGLGTGGFTRTWGYGPTPSDVIMLKPTLQVIPFPDVLSADVSYAVFWKSTNTNSHGGGVGRVVDGESDAVLSQISNANNRQNPNKSHISHFLGQEIDAHIVYYPYKNLMIKGWAGIFFPGQWFKVRQRSFNQFGTETVDNVGLKPAWALQLDVIVTF